MENPYEAPGATSPPAGCDSKSKPSRWKIGRQLAGWGLMALGVAGLLLPILPGWFFLAWGAIVLAPDVPFLSRLLDRIGQRVPQLRAAIDRARGKSKK
jgi:hypothetical protein